jgi:hypothetical protein
MTNLFWYNNMNLSLRIGEKSKLLKQHLVLLGSQEQSLTDRIVQTNILEHAQSWTVYTLGMPVT